MSGSDVEEVRILVVEDDRGLGDLLLAEIEDMGYSSRYAATAEDALKIIGAWSPDVVVSDLRLPGADGLELLRTALRQYDGNPPDFVIITAFGGVAKAVESLKAGAEDFLTKPLDLEHFRVTIDRILERRSICEEFDRMKRIMRSESTFHGMHGRSNVMRELFRQISQLAMASGPVLIVGESGTGKELVARAIHRESRSRDNSFVAVNAAGIPKELLESEFFGHESGAFTGASKVRRGIFEEAQGGTLLLDEISEMPFSLQAKLLRMLQDGKIRPVGSNREKQVDVRILAATNRDIEKQVETGDFREDLFYRLEAFQLRVPPLRERESDVDLLSGIFLNKYASMNDKKIKGFNPQSLDILHRYQFPGNVRELQNAIERAVVFCNGPEIEPEHFPPRMRTASEQFDSSQRKGLLKTIGDSGDCAYTLAEVERMYIQHVLDKVSGNKRLAAKKLGIARRTLYRKLEP